MPDTIHIEALELQTFIGVPDEERAQPQRITLSLTLEPKRDFTDLGDDIENTVDYAKLCEVVEAICAERPRRLVETLVQEIAERLLETFAIHRIQVELHKFILPHTKYVSVKVERLAS
jgi:FolB domain-containing protein